MRLAVGLVDCPGVSSILFSSFASAGRVACYSSLLSAEATAPFRRPRMQPHTLFGMLVNSFFFHTGKYSRSKQNTLAFAFRIIMVVCFNFYKFMWSTYGTKTRIKTLTREEDNIK